MLESHPAEGEVPNFKGSMMLAVAESEAEVRALLEKDIYSRSGVWDLANAQIIPVGHGAFTSPPSLLSSFFSLSLPSYHDSSQVLSNPDLRNQDKCLFGGRTLLIPDFV